VDRLARAREWPRLRDLGRLSADLERACRGVPTDPDRRRRLLPRSELVATALGFRLRGATLEAEGDLDFRGTLGVSREAPVGFKAIRLRFELDTDEPEDRIGKLLELTERYCVVFQTLASPPALSMARASPG
jgi:hypothetical protein